MSILRESTIVSELMMAQHGEASAVESFHRHLPLQHMRCDLQPEKVASWWSTKYALKLNATAAAVLLKHKLLSENELESMRKPCSSLEARVIRRFSKFCAFQAPESIRRLRRNCSLLRGV